MKSMLGSASEAQVTMPAQGAKLKIKQITRDTVAADAQFGVPGALQYIADFDVVEPKAYKGQTLRAYFEIGSEDDPKAKNEETWAASRGAAGLRQLLLKSGTPIDDDDDEVWMEAAVGNTVCVHTTVKNGYARINMRDKFFRESDPDFVGIGTKIAEAGAGAKKPAAAKPKPKDDDEDEAPAPKKPAPKRKPVDEDDED